MKQLLPEINLIFESLAWSLPITPLLSIMQCRRINCSSRAWCYRNIPGEETVNNLPHDYNYGIWVEFGILHYLSADRRKVFSYGQFNDHNIYYFVASLKKISNFLKFLFDKEFCNCKTHILQYNPKNKVDEIQIVSEAQQQKWLMPSFHDWYRMEK